MDGLEKFREAFADYTENYVIIGGTACELNMADTVVRARATHDIDMVIIVENMTEAFARQFWQFVRDAGYRPERRKPKLDESPKYELYRFLDGKPDYPQMIELLSRHPDVLGKPPGLVIEPIPTEDAISSLSAIIMDDDFYDFTVRHSRVTDGIRYADPAALIALKAKAYLNLREDKRAGRHVNSKDIKKHRSDVLKNVVIMEDDNVEAPASIVACVHDFVSSIHSEWDKLASPLARSLDRDENFIEELLNQLEELFITQP